MKILKILGKPFTMLAGNVNHTVGTKIVTSVARHAAGAIGGFLLAHGLIAASASGTVEDAIGSILIALASGSGIAQKVSENAL